MSTIPPNATYPTFPSPDAAARRQCTSDVTPTVRHDMHTAESRSEKDLLMAAQFPTNVVVLPRPAPTKADRNRAAEAFALSLERAAGGDNAGEEAALRTALDAMPDDPAANINYGNRMYNSGRFQEALACYNTAVGSATTHVVALFNRGNALEELGFFAEAIADWTAAVALEPDCGDAHYNLARALSRDGRRREALRHWTKYLRLDRTSAWASRARQERKRLLKLEPLQIVSRKVA
jgi:tetratricopeptide (TPR) repeat protein